MSGVTLRIIFLLVSIVIVDFIVIIGLKRVIKYGFNTVSQKIIINLVWIETILVIISCVLYYKFCFSEEKFYVNIRHLYESFSIFLMFFIPKIIFALFTVVYLLSKYIIYVFRKIFIKRNLQIYSKSRLIINCFLYTGIIFGLIFELSFLYGMIYGKTNYKVENIKLKSNELPNSFNDFKIVQISDLHIGSFSNVKDFDKVIDLINIQNPDIVVFTGDLINSHICEAFDYTNSFKRIKSKYGNFAILGNHDIGDYRKWYSDDKKINDTNLFKSFYDKINFKLLINQHIYLKRQNDSICLIGVLNWGLPPFKKYGDLKKALQKTSYSDFKILLSHDPSHWEEEIINKTNIFLTLSGHTHGGQFGINTEHLKWSPVKYMYKELLGLYQQNNQYLYVNPGIGYIGISSRINISPEITVITLKK